MYILLLALACVVPKDSGVSTTGTTDTVTDTDTDTDGDTDADGDTDTDTDTDADTDTDTDTDTDADTDTDTGVCDKADPCVPYWCDCGTCEVEEVQCVLQSWASANECALTCPSQGECPKVECSCDPETGVCVKG